jgi:hypothetical protein
VGSRTSKDSGSAQLESPSTYSPMSKTSCELPISHWDRAASQEKVLQ